MCTHLGSFGLDGFNNLKYKRNHRVIYSKCGKRFGKDIEIWNLLSYQQIIKMILYELFILKYALTGVAKRGGTPQQKLSQFKIFDKNLNKTLSEGLPFIFEDDDFNIHLKTNKVNHIINITGWVLNRKKIIQNWVKRILDKGDQLPPNKGGVIIGSTSRLWDPTDFDYANEQIQSELRYGSHKRISGIIFCSKRLEGVPVLQSDKLEFIKVLPVPLINTNTNVDITDKILIMRKSLFDFPDWISGKKREFR